MIGIVVQSLTREGVPWYQLLPEVQVREGEKYFSKGRDEFIPDKQRSTGQIKKKTTLVKS